jgi:hypothetical protein
MGVADRAKTIQQYQVVSARLDDQARVIEGLANQMLFMKKNAEVVQRNTERMRTDIDSQGVRLSAHADDLRTLHDNVAALTGGTLWSRCRRLFIGR